jgi:hypothetical protein
LDKAFAPNPAGYFDTFTSLEFISAYEKRMLVSGACRYHKFSDLQCQALKERIVRQKLVPFRKAKAVQMRWGILRWPSGIASKNRVDE